MKIAFETRWLDIGASKVGLNTLWNSCRNRAVQSNRGCIYRLPKENLRRCIVFIHLVCCWALDAEVEEVSMGYIVHDELTMCICNIAHVKIFVLVLITVQRRSLTHKQTPQVTKPKENRVEIFHQVQLHPKV